MLLSLKKLSEGAKDASNLSPGPERLNVSAPINP
jgi:hypothetical protein